MTVDMLGYIQSRLVGDSARATAYRLEDSARVYGGSVRIFHEAASPVQVLWGLLEAFDAEMGTEIAGQMWRFAYDRGLDMGRVLESPPPATALLALLGAVAESDPGYVVVPSLTHFDGLSVPRQLIRQLITRIAPQCRVIDLDRGHEHGRAGSIAEIDVVPAAPMAVQIVATHVRRELNLRALGDVISPVLAVLNELVGEAVQHAAADPDSPASRLRVEVVCPPESTTVIVDVIESRDHVDEPVSAPILRYCAAANATVHRFRSNTGTTLTRCEVPLPDALHVTVPHHFPPRSPDEPTGSSVYPEPPPAGVPPISGGR